MENNSSIMGRVAAMVIILAIFAIVVGCAQQDARESYDNSYIYGSKTGSSTSSGNYSSASYGSYKSYSNSRRALTKEEALRLRGTGFHNTKPGSNAELMELAAAQVKCDTCGMRTESGSNSTCRACLMKKYG